jgi:hypothetical protein
MESTIERLPFDIVDSIAGRLDVRSLAKFGRSCPRFHKLLSPTTPYHRAAVQLDQHEALRTARPYSASILAFAESFCYNQGVLVYSRLHGVRILDVHNSARLERVIPYEDFPNQLGNSGDLDDGVLSILWYCDGVAAVLYKRNLEWWLFAVDVRPSCETESRSRFLWRRRLRSFKNLFVRCNASYLYFGTHSVVLGTQDHYEWLIHGFDLTTGEPVTSQPIRLNGFVGSKIGTTAEFAIHGDSFYAVSNQSSHEPVEINQTSNYNYICFPLCNCKPDVSIKSIYRRLHQERFINEDFTNLSLQVDPQTNDLLIIECRLGDGDIRTCYTTKFPALRPKSGKPRALHQDYTGDQDNHFINPKTRKTKCRTYNSSAHSFVDVVKETLSGIGYSRPPDLIRLRVASRMPKSPLEPNTNNAGRPALRKPLLDEDDKVVKDSEDFQQTEAHVWPPNDAPQQIFDILCPGRRAETVHAVLDDRSIVYMVGPQQAEERAIVMVSFDPTWGFKGMLRREGVYLIELKGKSAGSNEDRSSSPSPEKPDEAMAMYWSIREGFWLR